MAAIVGALSLAALVSGCGGSSSTTVIKKQSAPVQQQTVTETTTTKAASSSGSGSSAPASQPTTQSSTPSSAPPDVTGLTLPTAKRQLASAGYKADVRNTDTAFGIIVPEHYTVCEESDPRGDIVPILAQKYGC